MAVNDPSALADKAFHRGPNHHPLLLFLDPDTGLEPQRATVTHTTNAEVRYAWNELKIGDWLVFYQHARRDNDWVRSVSAQLSEACGGAKVEIARSEEVGKDVAFLCVEKREGQPRIRRARILPNG